MATESATFWVKVWGVWDAELNLTFERVRLLGGSSPNESVCGLSTLALSTWVGCISCSVGEGDFLFWVSGVIVSV